jgi:hypothetical protein
MIANLAVGGMLVAISIVIHSIGLLTLSGFLRTAIRYAGSPRNRRAMMAIRVATVFGLFLTHLAEICAWALGYLALGASPTLDHALVFSTLSFSTLGAEEISLPLEWTLLGAIEGVAGFLLIGWSTAYLIPAWTKYGPPQGDDDF